MRLLFSAAFILLVVAGSSFALFEDVPSIVALTDSSQLDLIKEGEQDRRVAIIAVWDEDSSQSSNSSLEKAMTELSKQNDGLFQLFHADCGFFSSDEIAYCKHDDEESSKHAVPRILIFTPEEKTYAGAITAKDIAAFAKPLMTTYAVRRPTWVQIQTKILPDLAHPKVVLFTNKEESSPLFKALTQRFFERLLFLEVHSTQSDVIKQFNIEKYPTLMVLRVNSDGKVEAVTFNGKIEMKQIFAFLEGQALPMKRPFTIDFAGENKQAGGQQQQKFQSAFQDDDEDDEDTPSSSKKAATKDSSSFFTLSPKKYEKTLLAEDQLVLLHIYSAESGAHNSFAKLAEELHGAAIIYEIKVDTDAKKQFIESTLKVKQLPSIRVYPISSQKKITVLTQYATTFLFGPTASVETILEEIDEIVEDESFGASDEKMLQMAVSQGLQDGSSVQVLLHAQSKAPLAFRVASKLAAYKHNIKFVNLKNPSSAMLKQFQVTKMPTIAVIFRNVSEDQKDTPIKQEEVQSTHFHGQIHFDQYSKFLNQFAGKYAEVRKPEGTKDVAEITSQTKLDKICKRKTRFCFIALLNGDPALRGSANDDDDEEEEFENQTQLQQQLSTLKQVKDKLGSKPVQFGWIDAVCHSELLKKLEIYEDSLPNYILYNPSTKQVSTLLGRFEINNLEGFSQRALQGKTRLQTLSEEISLPKDRNCAEQHAILKKQQEEYEKAAAASNEFEDEILREMQEEERIRQEKIQAEIKAEKAAAKKRKSQKNNKKKTDL